MTHSALRSLCATLACTIAGMPVGSYAIGSEEFVGPLPRWTKPSAKIGCKIDSRTTCAKQPKQMLAHRCVALFAALALITIIPTLQVWAQSIPTSGDKFVGPFTSWANVKTTYGAKGDGVTDDTAALQRALKAVGQGGANPVLWIPAGTYIIS